MIMLTLSRTGQREQEDSQIVCAREKYESAGKYILILRLTQLQQWLGRRATDIAWMESNRVLQQAQCAYAGVVRR